MKPLVLTLMAALLVLGCSTHREEEAPPKDKDTVQVAKGVLSTPEYVVVEENDLSYGAVRRAQVKLRVPKALKEEEIRAVCEQLIPRYRKSHYSAVVFHFYLPDADTRGAHNAGMAEWGPHGSWDGAADMKAGDYSKHSLRVSVAKPPSGSFEASIPLEKRKKIFYDLVAEEDRLYALGVDDRPRKARAAIAKRYNLTIEEVQKIAA
ncbi:MAG: hypothetical protein H5U38_10055, partial [Calditrichaeota bacterium]|nr:hypothetical protein [Calditrichota bacterium]